MEIIIRGKQGEGKTEVGACVAWVVARLGFRVTLEDEGYTSQMGPEEPKWHKEANERAEARAQRGLQAKVRTEMTP